MKKKAFFLLLFYIDLCASMNDEGVYLKKFRDGVEDDPYGALSGWNGNDPCFWFGVECSNGRIVALNLRHLCLKGKISAEIGNLIHLKSLILENNYFYGTIPKEIGNLHNLEALDLRHNNFSGSLPSEIAKISSLEFLALHDALVDDTPQESDGNAKIRRLLQVGEHQKSKLKHRTISKISQSPNPFPGEFSLPPSSSPIISPDISPSYFFPPSPSPSITPSPSPVLEEPVSPTQSPNVQSVRPRKRTSLIRIYIPIALGVSLLITLCTIYFLCCRVDSRVTVRPWATGLSGQLQKAFVTGVPSLGRAEVQTACEDFSNIIGSLSDCNVYKGTLSSGVEIAVVSTVVTSAKDWSKQAESQFRAKILTLSKVNHKNFMNLIGYCEEKEPFTRMMVFEYAPNGTLFEHLHVKEAEHLNWAARLRIAMGVAYCLEHLQQLAPPVILNKLDSSNIYLTDDYASKVGDIKIFATHQPDHSGPLELLPGPTREDTVYKFGILLLEIVSGTHPSCTECCHWISSHLNGTKIIKEIVDPSLTSYSEEDVEALLEVIRSCVNLDAENRPKMGEVTAKLKEITAVNPDRANPSVSPLWWAELEIISSS